MRIVSTAYFKQRLIAFLIDYLIITAIVILIMLVVFLITGFDFSRYLELSNKANSFFMGKLKEEEFKLIQNEYASLVKIFDGSRYISSFVLVLIYYLYIPLKFKCETLGRKIMKCHVVKNSDLLIEVSPGLLAFREAICTFILYYLIGIPAIVLSAIICILFEKSLVDMISKTRLISSVYLEVPNRDINENDDHVGNAYRDYVKNLEDDKEEDNSEYDEEIILK